MQCVISQISYMQYKHENRWVLSCLLKTASVDWKTKAWTIQDFVTVCQMPDCDKVGFWWWQDMYGKALAVMTTSRYQPILRDEFGHNIYSMSVLGIKLWKPLLCLCVRGTMQVVSTVDLQRWWLLSATRLIRLTRLINCYMSFCEQVCKDIFEVRTRQECTMHWGQLMPE